MQKKETAFSGVAEMVESWYKSLEYPKPKMPTKEEEQKLWNKVFN
jgi:hypothetical protein